jgi:hypothetical protein
MLRSCNSHQERIIYQNEPTVGTASTGETGRESSLKDRDVGSPQDYSISMAQDLEPNSGHETFPMKLHRLLEDLERRRTNGTEIASFTPDGLVVHSQGQRLNSRPKLCHSTFHE